MREFGAPPTQGNGHRQASENPTCPNARSRSITVDNARSHLFFFEFLVRRSLEWKDVAIANLPEGKLRPQPAIVPNRVIQLVPKLQLAPDNQRADASGAFPRTITRMSPLAGDQPCLEIVKFLCSRSHDLDFFAGFAHALLPTCTPRIFPYLNTRLACPLHEPCCILAPLAGPFRC
jgi:hypothetical protein